MASLRLPSFTSTSYLCSEKFSVPKLRHNNTNYSFSVSLSLSSSCSLSHNQTFPIKPKRESRNFVCQYSVTTDNDPAVSDSSKFSMETASSEEEEYSKDRLIAQNVPWSSTAEDIRALFEKHGTVLDVELSMHNKTRNRGLAFVTMGSPEEALAALNSLESSEFEGRTLRINYAKLKKKKSVVLQPKATVPTFNLFVANLSFEARAKDLKAFFVSEGSEVVSAEVVFHDNPRRSSGYGFVSFKTKKEAQAALTAFQGKEFMGRPIRVAPSRQFVKLQTKEAGELNSDEEDTTDFQG